MAAKDFGRIPSVRFNRSSFQMPHGLKTTMSVGRLYPISIVEVLPGDSFKSNLTAVCRVSSSFIKPVIDNVFMDVYHFFVPLRLCYDKFEEVFGKASPSMYDDGVLEEIPTFDTAQTVSSKTVADYLGIPVGTVPKGLSILPFRAFALIYDKWFRNENITDEMYIQTGAINGEDLNNNPWSSSNYTGQLPFVGKKKDYFTSCLLKTQKGSPVELSLGKSAPVYAYPEKNPYVSGTSNLKFYTTGSQVESGKTYSYGGVYLADSGFDMGKAIISTNVVNQGATGYLDALLGPSNLRADMSSVSGFSVNDLRFAFQFQKMLERDALYGSRYNEYLLGHFGVTAPDARLQFPEYLGGGRIPINVQQVAQTSQSTTESPLANVAGYSLSNGYSKFSKGFVEHGYIITVACLRTKHTYQQGVPKLFSRSTRNDFYDPLYSSLGEQPVYKSELFVGVGTELRDENQIFGYNEAWAEYRYLPSTCTGEMRSSAENSLDIWHFADIFSNSPTLTDNFIMENSKNIDRTLSVPSEKMDNFICDFWFDTQAIRVMPTYSVPGLIDHH